MLLSSDLFYLNTQLLGTIHNKFDVIQTEFRESKPLEKETERDEMMHCKTLHLLKPFLCKAEP